mmetsp:Transcript_3721/g.6701  ORF Transcript_3721/g.6701 Transcript_3721/m.6701 type:complete len:359 (+) Transcript_3721:57-1133(+)
MGWGGKGKGHWHGPHHRHHHHGVGGVVAEAALVGGAAIAGAAVATAVASSKPAPRTEVVVVPSAAPVARPVVVEVPPPAPRPVPVAAGIVGGGAVGAVVGGPVGAVVGATVGAAVTAPAKPKPATVVVAGSAAPVVVVASKGKGKGKGKGKWKGGYAVAVEVPPLGVSAIGIPPTSVTQQSGVTYFGIDVMPEAGATYRVQKRYNEFDALKDRLARIAPGSLIDRGFPPKHLFSCEGAKLEERRRGLEDWLKTTLNSPNSRGAWCLELRQFLEVGQIHTLPAPGAVPEAALPAASAPEVPEGEALQIVIPDGVACGQALAVTVPDGRQLTFVVPAGYAAGSEIELWFDPAAGTLSPLV